MIGQLQNYIEKNIHSIPFQKTIKVPEDIQSVITYRPNDEVEPAEAGLHPQAVQEIWKSVEHLYCTGMYPAIILCLRRRGKIVLNRAIGHIRGNGPNDDSDSEKVLATPDTPICLFSASKAITAMLIHYLVDRCYINLNDPVSYYIPEFSAHGKGATTIYQMLAHQGGIPYPPDGVDPSIIFDHDAFIQMLAREKPVAKGGQKMAYHAITAGYVFHEIIKRVTDMDLRQFMAENIQKPLNFKYFNYGVPENERHNVALNYFTGLPMVFPLNVIVKRSLTVSWEEVVHLSNDPRFMETIIPSANLVATADEMSRFFQLMLNGGELDNVRIFDPITIRRAISNTDTLQLDNTMMVPMRYSAGMMLGYSPFGLYGPFTQQAFGHIGFMNIFCWADPERDISVALLNTGKALAGTHLMSLIKLLCTISWYCRNGVGNSEMSDFWCAYGLPMRNLLTSLF